MQAMFNVRRKENGLGPHLKCCPSQIPAAQGPLERRRRNSGRSIAIPGLCESDELLERGKAKGSTPRPVPAFVGLVISNRMAPRLFVG